MARMLRSDHHRKQWLDAEATIRAQDIPQLTVPVQNHQGDMLDAALIEIRRLQACNERTDDFLAVMRVSQIDRVRFHATLLTCRVNQGLTLREQLAFAESVQLDLFNRLKPQEHHGAAVLESLVGWDMNAPKTEAADEFYRLNIALYGMMM